jgi:hypothetical protein
MPSSALTQPAICRRGRDAAAVQAFERRIALKQRDGGIDVVILLGDTGESAEYCCPS